MMMYMFFNNDLLNSLCAAGVGARLSYTNNVVVCPAYADDVSMLTLYKPHMQQLLNIAYRHSCLWHYEFNPNKSHTIIFGKDNCPGRNLYLGDQRLSIVSCESHLGVPLCPDAAGITRAVESRVNIGRRNAYAAVSIGSNMYPLPPIVSSKLYWSVGISQMLYGLEFLHLPRNALDILEQAHLSIGRSIQGLPRTSPNVAVLPSLGWLCIRSWLSYKRLVVMWTLLMADMNCLYKHVTMYRFIQIHTNRLVSNGPVGLMYNTCKEYGLVKFVMQSINNGVYISMSQWKTRIKNVIYHREKCKWIANCMLYKSIGLYTMCIEYSMTPWAWWIFCNRYPQYVKHCRVILRLLIGNHAMSERRRLPGATGRCNECVMIWLAV